MGLVPVLDHNKMFVTDKNGVTRKANRFEISRRENQLFHQCVWLTLEKSVEEFVSLEEAQDKYTEVAGELAADTLRVAHQNQNRDQGVTKAQYVEATMAFMEKENAFVKMYDKWLHEAANINLEDGSKQVCRLKQTCTPTGAARKYLTTVTDVCLLNYAVSLDEARDGTQKNTQGVWPCKLPIDSLPLQQLGLSPALMSCLSKQPRRWFPTAPVGDTVQK